MRPALTNALTNAIREALNYSTTNLDSEPVINYVARLNGDGQYWEFIEPVVIPANVNFEITLENLYSEEEFAMAIAGDDIFPNIYIRSDGIPVFQPVGGVFLPANDSVVGREVSIKAGVSSGEMYIQEVGGTTKTKNIDPLPELTFTTIGARQQSLYLKGYLGSVSVSIEGAVVHEIPLTNKAQGAYQVATTTPLGANLYTPEVIENPNLKGSQWSNLGGGRYQLDGDGSLNVLSFIFSGDQPSSGYVEFEIESISGGVLSCTQSSTDGSRFDSSGIKSFYYADTNEIQSIQFKRATGAIQAIIKNIKHYDAEGILVAEMVGYSGDVWEEV